MPAPCQWPLRLALDRWGVTRRPGQGVTRAGGAVRGPRPWEAGGAVQGQPTVPAIT